MVEAGGVYTLELYYLDGTGTEQAYTHPGGDIDFEFPYLFTFDQLPRDALLRIHSLHLDDVGGGGLVMTQEVVAVTALNTLANTVGTYVGTGPFMLSVNGKLEVFTGGAPSFTVAGQTITWNAANAGYDLETTDVVSVVYAT